MKHFSYNDSTMEDIENPLRINVSTASSTLSRSIGAPVITQRQDFVDNIFTKAPKPLSGLQTIKKDTEDFDL